MEILSLNDAYKFNALHYWCNSCGDINLPGDGRLWPRNANSLICHMEDDLPPKAKRLYESFWQDGGLTLEYVVQFNGRTGYAFDFLFDKDWINNLQIQIQRFRKIAAYVITEKLNDPLFEDCAFVYGNDTDPEGDEFLIVVPYNFADNIPIIRAFLRGCDLYQSIEYAVKYLS